MAIQTANLHTTFAELIEHQIPNFFRLYANPWVAKTCLALSEYAHHGWHRGLRNAEHCVFLTNSGEEALSGAIKLARFYRSSVLQPSDKSHDLLIDSTGDYRHFGSTYLSTECADVVYLPQLRTLAELTSRDAQGIGTHPLMIVVSSALAHLSESDWQAVQEQCNRTGSLTIVVVKLVELISLRQGSAQNETLRLLTRLIALNPQIVVLDESGTDHEVPFGAMIVKQEIMNVWQQSGWTNFHSTTYQPNSIASMHFLHCLKKYDPEFFVQLTPSFTEIDRDPKACLHYFQRFYSPALSKWIRYSGFANGRIKAVGHYIEHEQRKVFDGVAGVACSIRGHNPPSFLSELQQQESASTDTTAAHDTAELLHQLTDLNCHVPSVSGASAVEAALRIALCAQFPRKRIICLRGGFGGKTLLALTGTAKPYYKQHLEPLYEEVVYIDPFSPDACLQLEQQFQASPVALVQLELIQGVGGVREIPRHIIHYLEMQREQHGYLIFIDEIQTGMFRTGPFVRFKSLGLRPIWSVLARRRPT